MSKSRPFFVLNVIISVELLIDNFFICSVNKRGHYGSRDAKYRRIAMI
jgi:hypothetical protein